MLKPAHTPKSAHSRAFLLAVLAGFALPLAAVAQDQSAATAGRRPRLSDEQRSQIQALRTQLDNGQLSPKDFATQVDAILGDQFAGPRWGRPGWGAAKMQNHLQRLADKLQLTDEQRTTARQIFNDARHQARVLHLEAMARMRLALTPEQRAQFDQLRAEHFSSLRGKGAAGQAAPNAATPGSVTPQNAAPGQPAPGPGAKGHGGAKGGDKGGWAAKSGKGPGFLGRLADQLQLTDDQRATMKSIRTETRDAVRTVFQGARQKFASELTPDQAQQLQDLKAQRHERAGGAKPQAPAATPGNGAGQ